MKKLICLAAVLLICFSLAAPVLASEDIFVPSITYKNGPDVEGASFGENVAGVTSGDGVDGQTPDYGDLSGCVVITSIIQAQEKTTDIYEEDRQLLLDVYEELTQGKMALAGEVIAQEEPPEEEPEGVQKVLKAIESIFLKQTPRKEGIEVQSDGTMRLIFGKNEYVIKELVDVSFVRSECVEVQHLHKETLEREEIHVEVDFDMGLSAEDNMVVLYYHDGVWSPIQKAVNNGDGTLTCTFDHFCPVAFCLEMEEIADTAQGGGIFLWVLIMLMALAALIFLVTRRKKAETSV